MTCECDVGYIYTIYVDEGRIWSSYTVEDAYANLARYCAGCRKQLGTINLFDYDNTFGKLEFKSIEIDTTWERIHDRR